MGNRESGAAEAEADAWLRAGGVVVAASERAARGLTAAFHEARRSEGLAAWPAPHIQHWQSFVRGAWEARDSGDRLVMNPLQEKALWAEIVGAERSATGLLEGPRRRLAEMAMEAHALLCAYAPQFLNPKARNGWQQDAAVFSGWLTEFEAACRSGRLLSVASLPLELMGTLEQDRVERPPLLLAAFDRMLPVQRKLFEAWGATRGMARGERAAEIAYHEAMSEQAELAACALWCQSKLAANPRARLLVLTQDAGARRGEMERAFLRHGGGIESLFEFTLGVPLSSVCLIQGAHLILRWLEGAIDEHEVDWLFSSALTGCDEAEGRALTGFMRGLRRRGRERTRWSLDSLLAEDRKTELPPAWRARMLQARRRLSEAAQRQPAWAWAELVPQLLQAAGWPGAGSLSSAEFQALGRWEQALDACASLSFDGSRMNWSGFLAALGSVLEETLFAPESRQRPIQIAGPAESAGLTADAVWFMGASDEAWPGAGSMHPFLPFAVQREAGMPHAAAQLDWEVASAVTARIVASAPEVHFSYSRQCDGVEQRPSRMITQLAGLPEPLPAALLAPAAPAPLAAGCNDLSRVPLREGQSAGGSTVLTAQSQCPFKAFATARLGAQGWERAQAGLTPAQRGELVHQVLHSVWSAPPRGIRTHAELVAIGDLRGFVEDHVRLVLAARIPAAAREQMPQRYLELEAERLANLLTEWLEFERSRAPFVVEATEFDKETVVAGLTLRLRLDRLDRLNDGTCLVVDYKTGDIKPKVWEMPRPEDVQLPLYAGFALDRELQPLGGLVFAKLRAGEPEFAGRVGNPQTTLLPGLGARKTLARDMLNCEEFEAWRGYIEQMARDFLSGQAGVDPRDPVKTCERCDLHALCRVQQSGSASGEEGEEGEDA